MGKLTLKDLPLDTKKVLLRVDFNVPMKDGKIDDDSRIKAAMPTIQYILDHNGSLIIMSHLGRPAQKPDPKFSLAPVAKRLSELLNKPVTMAKDCIGEEAEQLAGNLKPGEILFLENVRFHPGEEKPEQDPSFAKQLANLGNCYVNDAFGTAHRAHSSTATIASFFPKASAMGFLMEKEIEELSPLIKNPKSPFYALIGGAKVSSKIGVIQELLEKVDRLFIGGGMIYTFLKADGIQIGNSLFESPETVKNVPRSKLIFPTDLVIADALSNDANQQVTLAKDGIPDGWQGVDIGPETIKNWSNQLQNAATVFWNGPLGIFEMPNFAKGTKAIAECLANLNAKKIVGGGDSVSAIEHLGLANQFSHLSTGGGASLEFLQFGHLPGIDALSNK